MAQTNGRTEPLRKMLVSKAQRPPNEEVLKCIVGQSPKVETVRGHIETVAPRNVPVLITGESGTGKELVALALHILSPRFSMGPFVAVNCATIPSELAESVLFGHTRGAFTGAIADQPGKFQLANGGTLFLDEIGDLPFPIQAKLLRVLETAEVDMLGAREPIPVNVRLITATHRDVDSESTEKKFRDDLLYRIAKYRIRVPSLAERVEDIPSLAHYFLDVFNHAEKTAVSFHKVALEMLREISFPGNVRQLRNVIECAAVIAAERNVYIDAGVMSTALANLRLTSANKAWGFLLGIDEARFPKLPVNFEEIVSALKRHYISNALRQGKGNLTRAAELLGMERRVLSYAMTGLINAGISYLPELPAEVPELPASSEKPVKITYKDLLEAFRRVRVPKHMQSDQYVEEVAVANGMDVDDILAALKAYNIDPVALIYQRRKECFIEALEFSATPEDAARALEISEDSLLTRCSEFGVKLYVHLGKKAEMNDSEDAEMLSKRTSAGLPPKVADWTEKDILKAFEAVVTDLNSHPETQSLKLVSERFGMPVGLLCKRIGELGIEVEACIINARRRVVVSALESHETLQGAAKSLNILPRNLSSWCSRLGVKHVEHLGMVEVDAEESPTQESIERRKADGLPLQLREWSKDDILKAFRAVHPFGFNLTFYPAFVNSVANHYGISPQRLQRKIFSYSIDVNAELVAIRKERIRSVLQKNSFDIRAAAVELHLHSKSLRAYMRLLNMPYVPEAGTAANLTAAGIQSIMSEIDVFGLDNHSSESVIAAIAAKRQGANAKDVAIRINQLGIKVRDLLVMERRRRITAALQESKTFSDAAKSLGIESGRLNDLCHRLGIRAVTHVDYGKSDATNGKSKDVADHSQRAASLEEAVKLMSVFAVDLHSSARVRTAFLEVLGIEDNGQLERMITDGKASLPELVEGERKKRIIMALRRSLTLGEAARRLGVLQSELIRLQLSYDITVQQYLGKGDHISASSKAAGVSDSNS